MGVREFGRLADGESVVEVTIAGEGLAVSLLGYGAAIRRLDVDTAGGPRNVVLGFDRLEDYVDRSPYFGAVVGRCANRIAAGRFTLDGRDYQLSINEAGRTHLHGGTTGFAWRNWSLAGHDDRSATFTLVSPDGEDGYPGEVRARCRYEIAGPGRLVITLEATTDAPTLVNLATHAYFNLDGGADILDHEVTIPAATYTPYDDHLIPTGAFAAVEGGTHDFRHPRPLRMEVDGERVRYDANFVVAEAPAAEPRPMARVRGPASGLVLEVHSTEPCLQFYDGAKIDIPVRGTDGRRFVPCAGLCLEPQRIPDAVNHAAFPTPRLDPGETYRQVTEYHFSQG